MDVDNDIDQSFLQQFSCLGTQDKDVLIDELQKLVGNQLNATGCAFFLDMNNWNLQAAVCSYFDYESPRDKLPIMALIRDVSVGEADLVPPNSKFIKTWTVRNTGEEQWPLGCCLRFTHGCRLDAHDRVLVKPLLPGETIDVSVEMMSPEKVGIYQGQWRMSTQNGFYFGDVIWVIITVSEDGVLSLTEQMSKLHDLGTSPKELAVGPQPLNSTGAFNPFAVPNGTTVVMPNGITSTNSNSTVTMANVKSATSEVWTTPTPGTSTIAVIRQLHSHGDESKQCHTCDEEDMMA